MSALPRTTFAALRLWVLAWFVASMGVAIASPLVNPQSFEVICSGTGAIKLLVQTDDGTVEMGAMGMDCPLCATPSAPPASPAAGWIQISEKGPSRRILPFATQFSATPPARHSRPRPVSKNAVRAILNMISSHTTCTDRARSSSRCVSFVSGTRGGPPNSRSKARLVMVSPAR